MGGREDEEGGGGADEAKRGLRRRPWLPPMGLGFKRMAGVEGLRAVRVGRRSIARGENGHRVSGWASPDGSCARAIRTRFLVF